MILFWYIFLDKKEDIMDLFGERMKSYEQKANFYLEKKIPVVIRLDGKAFHTFTKGLEKPFDSILVTAMQKTMTSLCENIQGCVFGYCQSDEITLILVDYQTLNTDAWFDYKVQKLCSVSASMATLYFNQHFRDSIYEYLSPASVALDDLIEDSEEGMDLK